MKAVVLEVRDGFAAVLREDGTVEKLRRDCRVGETIDLEERSGVTRISRRPGRWVAAAAAALVVLSSVGGWGYNNAYAYSYVTLDAKPSIEYVLNRRNRIIGVTGLNEDGAALAETLSGLKNESLTAAMAAATDILYEQDYLGEEAENCLLINVSSRGESQQAALTEEIDAYFAALTEEDAPEVYVTSASREDARRARELGVSTGKYVVARQIAEQTGGDPDDTAALSRRAEESVGRLLEENGVRRVSREEQSVPTSAQDQATPSGEPEAPEAQPPSARNGAQEQPAREETPVFEGEAMPGTDGGADAPREGGPTDMGGSPSGEPSR